VLVAFEAIVHHVRDGHPRARTLITGILASFDSSSAVQHARSVVRVIRRLAALAAVLMLCIGNVAVCAGWQATPEARMACCQDEASCPMHKSESHSSRSNHHVTQVQADNCCAGSERNDSATTRPAFASSGIVALVAANVPLVVTPSVPALQECRAFIPPPVSTTPKHLLLSVFLV
jgi:hypothetical protein